MRPARTLAIAAAALTLGWFASAPPATVPHPPVLSAVAATTSTSAAPPPTTTTVVPPTTTHTHPPRAVVRASRAKPAPRVAVAAQVQDHAGGFPAVMLRIRFCESRNNYTAQNRTSTASGAWQFLDSSWAHYAGYPRAYLAPPAVQDQKAMNVYNAVGTRPWNASRRCWG